MDMPEAGRAFTWFARFPQLRVLEIEINIEPQEIALIQLLPRTLTVLCINSLPITVRILILFIFL